jgi:hypothetical protein
MAKLVDKYLDPRAYKVVLGGVKEITRVLELKCAFSSSFSLSVLAYYGILTDTIPHGR